MTNYRSELRNEAAILYGSGYRHYENLDELIDWPEGADDQYKEDLRDALEEFDLEQIEVLSNQVEETATTEEIEAHMAETWSNYKNAPAADVSRIAKEVKSMNYQQRVQEALRGARESAGLSQQELADRIGVSRPRISEWELGTRTPGLETIIKIAQAAGLKASDLVAQIEGESD